MSDRLGVDNLLGGSEDQNDDSGTFKLSAALASGRHSKDAAGNLKSMINERRYIPSSALEQDTPVAKFIETLKPRAVSSIDEGKALPPSPSTTDSATD
jgi:hypothetical protein